MNIGEAVWYSGLPAKTIRYYEDIGLVAPTRRTNGYRVYNNKDIKMLVFLSHARGLGFSIEDCRMLLSLCNDNARSSAEVKALTISHIAEIERKISELEDMHRTLLQLAESCHGNERPDCPILDELADV